MARRKIQAQNAGMRRDNLDKRRAEEREAKKAERRQKRQKR